MSSIDQFFQSLGLIAAVAMESAYRDWFLHDLDRNIRPALEAGNYKIYLNADGRPLAFITWALLDDERHSAMAEFGENPPDGLWNSGDNLWFVDIVAPYGGTLDIVRDMQRNYFPDRDAHSIKRNETGGVGRIKTWRNTLRHR